MNEHDALIEFAHWVDDRVRKYPSTFLVYSAVDLVAVFEAER